VQRLAKQVQGALPIVGLLSRLGASGGGIGLDELVRTATSHGCLLFFCRRTSAEDFLLLLHFCSWHTE